MIKVTLTLSTGREYQLKFRAASADAPDSVRHREEVESAEEFLNLLVEEKLVQLSGDDIQEEAATFEEAFYINPQQIVTVLVSTVEEN